jgi:hypothetical protein
MGSSQVVLTHGTDPGDTISPGYVAAGFGHRGFAAWDSMNGSHFVALALDGSPAGTPVLLGSEVVAGLVATPGGFVAVQSPATYAGPDAVLVLDPSGAVLTTTPLAAPGPNAYSIPGPALLAFDDGTLLTAWEGDVPFAMMAQHLSATGAPLAAPAQLFDISAQTTGYDYFSMISLGASALVAWGNDYTGYRAVATADEDGKVGAATTFGSGMFEGLAVGDGALGALAAWAEVPDGSAVGTLLVQRMSAGGAPIGVAFQAAEGFMAEGPVFASTPAGQVLGFTGITGKAPQQAYLTLLSCGH